MYILLNKEGRIIARSDIKQNNFIEIEDEKIEEISKANIYDYLYINNKFIYKPIEVDLKKVLENKKAQKVEELKAIREEKENANLEVEGALFQVRREDIQRFFLKKIEHDLIPEANKKETWRLADNTYKEITFEDIEKILKAYGDRQRKVFYEFGVLEAQVIACNSVEEIEAIKWL